MKKLKLLLLILILVVWFNNTIISQDSELTHKINLIGYYDGNGIWLRWDVSDVKTWELAKQNGFTLVREIIGNTEENFSVEKRIESRKELFLNQLPKSYQEWENIYSDKKIAARELIYSDTIGGFHISGDSVSMKDAIRYNELQENKLDMCITLASQDFEIAQAMSLGFLDESVEPNLIIRYIVKIGNNVKYSEIEPGILDIKTDVKFDFPIIDLQGYGTDSTAVLKWKLQNISEYYNSYTIERRTENTDFITVNKAPFVYWSQTEAEPLFAYYTDKLFDNKTEYIYRVAGNNYFGKRGPFSDTIHIIGKPSKLNMTVGFDSVNEIQNGGVILKWNDDTNHMNPFLDKVKGYNLYKADEVNGKYIKLNTQLLPTSVKSYIDYQPFSSTYYALECFDKNGYQYLSYPHFIQVSDSIPPLAPTGLFGTVDFNGKVTLGWNKNSEPDVLGYRVYYSNIPDSSSFVQQTSVSIDTTFYTFNIDPNYEIDSIYIKIKAEDWRSNYSEYSAILALVRPDHIGPSNPVLLSAIGKPDGIHLKCLFSESKDVQKHLLMRKPDIGPGWEIIKTILKKDIDSIGNLIIDTTQLIKQYYQYRLIAYDDVDNASPSNIVKGRPFINLERGKIENFKGYYYCNVNANIQQPVSSLLTMIDSVLQVYEQTGVINHHIIITLYFYGYITATQANQYQSMTDIELAQVLISIKNQLEQSVVVEKICGAVLGWDYKFEGDKRDLEFKIYRGVISPWDATNSGPILFKSVKATESVLTNFQLQSNIQLNFTTTLGLSGQDNQVNSAPKPEFLFIDNSTEPRFTYLYQVMAEWKDGGYSKLTEPLLIYISPASNLGTGSLNNGN